MGTIGPSLAATLTQSARSPQALVPAPPAPPPPPPPPDVVCSKSASACTAAVRRACVAMSPGKRSYLPNTPLNTSERCLGM